MTITLSMVWHRRPRFARLAQSFSIRLWSSVMEIVRERRSIHHWKAGSPPGNLSDSFFRM